MEWVASSCMCTAAKPTVDDRVLSVFTTVFGWAELGPESSVDNLEGWDSLSHVNLVLALEDTFEVRFSPAEIVELTSVKKVEDQLKRKGAIE